MTEQFKHEVQPGWKVLTSAFVGHWDWQEFAVLRGPDGGLYTVDYAGCSCYYFDDEFSPADCVRAESWHNVMARLTKWAENDLYDGESTEEVSAMMNWLMTNRPKPWIEVD